MAKRKGEQQYLEGTAPVRNKRVHPLAVAYAEERDKRILANKAEKEAHDTLLYAMQEEGLESYEYGDVKIIINSAKKCKVVIAGSPKSEEDES